MFQLYDYMFTHIFTSSNGVRKILLDKSFLEYFFVDLHNTYYTCIVMKHYFHPFFKDDHCCINWIGLDNLIKSKHIHRMVISVEELLKKEKQMHNVV